MTFHFPRISAVAVFAAGLIAFAFSLIWYSPFLFGFVWAAASGEAATAMPLWKLFVAPLREIISAFILAVLLGGLGIADRAGAAALGVFLWFGFYVVQLAGAVIWDGMAPALGAIHAGDWLVKMVLMSLVLVSWPARARNKPASA
jgi:hypothetical protein